MGVGMEVEMEVEPVPEQALEPGRVQGQQVEGPEEVVGRVVV